MKRAQADVRPTACYREQQSRQIRSCAEVGPTPIRVLLRAAGGLSTMGDRLDLVLGRAGSAFELRSEVVVLRDFEAGDRSAFIDWAADEAMYTYMAWRLDGPATAAVEFDRLLSHPERANPARRHWYLAVATHQGEFCGTAGFDHRPDGGGELGWYLSSPHWGRGYATAATALLLEFGFRTVGVPSITATCDPENTASRRVLMKCGLRYANDETIDTWRGVRPRLRFRISSENWADALT